MAENNCEICGKPRWERSLSFCSRCYGKVRAERTERSAFEERWLEGDELRLSNVVSFLCENAMTIQARQYVRLSAEQKQIAFFGIRRHLFYYQKATGIASFDLSVIREVIDDAKAGFALAMENEIELQKGRQKVEADSGIMNLFPRHRATVMVRRGGCK